MDKKTLRTVIIACCTVGGFLIGAIMGAASMGDEGEFVAFLGLGIGLVIGVMATSSISEQIKNENTAALSSRYDNRPVRYYESVTYLSGHPELRKSVFNGALIIKDDAVAYLEKPDPAARELFNIPFSRVLGVKGVADKVSVTAFSEFVAITSTKEKNKRLAIAFRNDVNEESVILLQPPLGNQVAVIADEIDHTIYEWKKKSQAAATV